MDKEAEDESSEPGGNRQNKTLTLLRWIHKGLTCGKSRTYNLAQSQKEPTRCNSSLKKKFFKSRISFQLDQNERFYLSLYKEGLLKHNILIQEDNDEITKIALVFKFPILNICYGFADTDFGDCGSGSLSGAGFRYALNNEPNPWVQAGIDKECGSTRCSAREMKVDGVPASMWLDIMEPVLQTMLIMKKVGRQHRTNITKHRKPSPLHRNRRIVIGDVQQTYFMVGPQVHQPEIRLGIVAMFAHRLAELGQRAWRRELGSTPPHDVVIPSLREHRESTRNRPPRQDDDVDDAWVSHLHRSQSTSTLDLRYMFQSPPPVFIADTPILPQAHIERNGYTLFH